MTEAPDPTDQAERLRRLQERRAASSRSRPTPTVSAGSSPAAQSKGTRRRHPAAATRVLLAGLSVTSFFAVGGAIAVANRPATVAQPVAAAVPATNIAGTRSTTGTAAQPVAVTNATVHATTGGS